MENIIFVNFSREIETYFCHSGSAKEKWQKKNYDEQVKQN